jgi:hypothetical protein
MTIKPQYLQFTNFVLLLLFVSYLAVMAFNRPFHNWDMVIYAAAAEKNAGQSNTELHTQVWDAVKGVVSEERFQELCCSNEFRRERFENAKVFESHFPMYEVKAGYVWLLKGFSGILSPIEATIWISFLASAVIAICSWIAFGVLPGFYRFMWLPGLVLLELPNLARLSTPDALAAALFVVAALCLLKQRPNSATLLLLLGLTVRPDNVITCLFLAVYFAFLRHNLHALFLGIAAIAAYLLITRSVEHIGWWSHFFYTFLDRPKSLEGFNPDFDLGLYLEVLAKRVVTVVNSKSWAAMTILSLCIAMGAQRARGLSQLSSEQCFVVAMVASTLAHFLVFPITDGRIYGASLFPILLFMPALLAARLRKETLTE